jgi:hypothetical protein
MPRRQRRQGVDESCAPQALADVPKLQGDGRVGTRMLPYYVRSSLAYYMLTNNITRCRCQHEFCYLCLAKWKTCKCPAWDERNIINAPQPEAARAPVAPAPPPNPVVAPQPNPPAARLPVQVENPQLDPLQAALARANQAPPVRGHQVAQPQPPVTLCGRQGHDFQRLYRSMDWDTQCHLCSHKDRWVNFCAQCNLKVCWYCTKHRI